MLYHLTLPRQHNTSHHNFLYGFQIFSRMALETIGGANNPHLPPLGYATTMHSFAITSRKQSLLLARDLLFKPLGTIVKVTITHFL